MRGVVMVDCGGHGRELFDAIAACNALEPTWSVLGFVDDAPGHLERVEALGTTVLGPIDWLVDRRGAYRLGIRTSEAHMSMSARLDDTGDGARIDAGAGAVVLGDVEPGATILGVPGTQDIDVVDAVRPTTIASITVIAFIPAFAAPGPSR